jgi:hypothetical protein
MTRRSPVFAARLLKRLVPSQDHDVLLGDLNEEYQRGRSRVWYFAQIAAAIVVGSWKDLHAHPIVAARAVAIGLVAEVLLVTALPVVLDVLTGAGFMWGGRWIGLPWYWHWPYALSLDTVMMTIWIAGHLLMGWLIVRLHRAHGVTTVVLYCVVLGALHTAGVLQLAHVTGRSADLGALVHAAATGEIRESLLVMTGGYLATRPGEFA